MVSQKELLQETFADVMRGIGAAAKTMAPGLVSAYADVMKPLDSFKERQPLRALKTKIKEEYYNAFDRRTIKYSKPTNLPKDKDGLNRIQIQFTAERIEGVTAVSPGQPGGIQGGVKAIETFNAILTRKPDGTFDIAIVDESNQPVRGVKEKPESNKKSWNQLYSASGLGPAPTVKQLAKWITSSVKNYGSDGIKELFKDELGVRTFNKNDVLTMTTFLTRFLRKSAGVPVNAQNLQRVKQLLIDDQVVTENRKINKSQLNFLIDSYNMRYEVSINKGN